MYDTTLDIKLTADRQGWIDDFGVKGPAPDSAKLSWDKSPVANGAHYFLFGRVDKNDPPGVLREKGFGVGKSLLVLIVLSLRSKTHNPFRSRVPQLHCGC